LTICLPASDIVVILCGDAKARPFVSKDAHRAGTSISQRDHSSSLLTDCLLIEKEKIANSHSKRKKGKKKKERERAREEVMVLLKVGIIKYLQLVALRVGMYSERRHFSSVREATVTKTNERRWHLIIL